MASGGSKSTGSSPNPINNKGGSKRSGGKPANEPNPDIAFPGKGAAIGVGGKVISNKAGGKGTRVG